MDPWTSAGPNRKAHPHEEVGPAEKPLALCAHRPTSQLSRKEHWNWGLSLPCSFIPLLLALNSSGKEAVWIQCFPEPSNPLDSPVLL